MAPWISKRDPNLCQGCQYCRKWVYRYESCIDCCACHFSCSYCAVKMEERASWETITIHFAGKPLRVPSGIPVKEALELSGYPISPFPKRDRIFVPCEVGSLSNNRKGRDGTDSFKKFHYLLSTFSFSDFKKLRSEKHIRAKPFPGTGFGVGKKSED